MTTYLAAAPTAEQMDGLRSTMQHAAVLPVYGAVFAKVGIDQPLIERAPLDALRRFPLFEVDDIDALAGQVLRQSQFQLGGIELTSGTSRGRPKRRIISEADVVTDAALVTGLLRIAGIRAGDRVAAIDSSVSALLLAFLEGVERLGATVSLALSASAPGAAARLRRLAVTVLVGVPSVFERWCDELTSWPAHERPRLIIYNGDRLPAETIARYAGAGIATRSLYGMTETSALGAACAEGPVIHLAADYFLGEVLPGPQPDCGELVVTTLAFAMPLLRYPTGDLVRLLPSPCTCGNPEPRLELLGRLDHRLSFSGFKVNPEELRRSLAGDYVMLTYQLIASTSPAGIDRLTVRLPEALRPRRSELLAILRAHHLLDYLVHTGALELRLLFAPPQTAGRRLPVVIDKRGAGRDNAPPSRTAERIGRHGNPGL